jgi:hypothetical protein
MAPPRISTEQMIALHGFFAHAVAVGEASLSELAGCETEVEVVTIQCTPLARFGEEGLRLSDDLVAGVMGRMAGAMPGSACLVLEPEEALFWARRAGGEAPLEAFVALGQALLVGIAAALAETLEARTELCDARLAEEPELAMLVRTHAPLDTMVFSIPLHILLRDEILTAHVHLLFEPKYLSRLLSALSAAAH